MTPKQDGTNWRASGIVLCPGGTPDISRRRNHRTRSKTFYQPLRGAERQSGLEWALVALAVLYPVALMAGPLLAIVWGALSSGFGAMARQLTSPEAAPALKLTLLLSFAATALNTVFGLVVALVLTRDDFKGRRALNGLIDLPFTFSPVIAGFTLILLFGRNG
jgi:sulfate transport system permease protein